MIQRIKKEKKAEKVLEKKKKKKKKTTGSNAFLLLSECSRYPHLKLVSVSLHDILKRHSSKIANDIYDFMSDALQQVILWSIVSLFFSLSTPLRGISIVFSFSHSYGILPLHISAVKRIRG